MEDPAIAPIPALPPAAQVLFDTARAHHQAGRLAEAASHCREALALAPDHADGWYLLGVVALQRGNPAGAADALRRALQLAPGNARALSNLGVALTRLGKTDDALAAFDQAVAADPGYAEAWNNRGNARRLAGQTTAAVVDFDRALQLRPDHVEAWVNRSHALREQHRFAEALASIERALQLRPDHVNALVSRGVVLQRLKRPGDALACYEQALQRAPGLHALHNNRGAALRELKRHDLAAAAFATLAERQPDFECALSNRLHSQLYACDWRDHAELVTQVRSAVARGQYADVPFSFLCIADAPAEQLICARTYAARHWPRPAAPLPAASGAGSRRLKVAYLSADFHEHATAFLMARLFELHDRTRFETIAVSFGPDSEQPMRQRLRAAFDHFLEVREVGDAEVVAQLRALGVDIAVDLKGYTTDNRAALLAQRVAPVQVNYLGYPGTMGAPFVDYLLADATVVPPGDEIHYQEQVVRLPHCYQANDDRRARPEAAATRAELGLPEHGFVFCCFNNNFKFTPEVFARWMRLLAQVPDSVLWLFVDTPIAADNLRRAAAAQGVDPARLVFAGRLAPSEHLARYRRADLFLDTWPCNAHTTASDALWMGVPVLTKVGRGFAARVAASLLRAADLPELVVATAEDYEALALALARDPGRLAALRARLETARTQAPLFDSARFTGQFEAALLEMHARRARGEEPAGFDVSA